MQIKKTMRRSFLVASAFIGLGALVSVPGCGGSATPDYELQILHLADMDGDDNVALGSVGNLSGYVQSFRAERPNNTLVLSSGDNYIPGPRLSAAGDPAFQATLRSVRSSPNLRVDLGRGDIALVDALGVQASALGNHELDLGTSEFRGMIRRDERSGESGPRWDGARFPYLSYNADFSRDSNISDLVVANGTEASQARGRLAGWVTVTMPGGQRIGLIGASSPTFPSITSPGNIAFAGRAQDGSVDIAALAANLQRGVDEITAAGINKVILLSHMQQISVEIELAKRLRNVDIIIAGGSNTRLGNSRMRPGEVSQGPYPRIEQSPTNPVAILNVDGDYKYLGRFIAPFDASGRLMDWLIDSRSDAYGTSAVDTAGGVTPITEVVSLRDSLRAIVQAQDGNVFGASTVYLDGRRSQVRTQETNLGNLTADANLWYAQQFDTSAQISLKNGGGIRSDIGFIEAKPGSTEVTFKPIAANGSIRAEGRISQLAIQNSLRFNNGLVVISVTASRLKELLEHGVSAWTPSATPGQFPQVGGMSFSFDPSLAARTADGNGQRVRSLRVGSDVVVQNGALVGDPNRTFRMVTLNFLANVSTSTGVGGDNYPFPPNDQQSRLTISDSPTALPGQSTFAAKGTEQDALARYLRDGLSGQPFTQPETTDAQDTRIQNLSKRTDAVLTQ
jgi:2',3'-cyclic-nucleotide 2'-phosphodiesterase (5'-nucleotidase family)